MPKLRASLDVPELFADHVTVSIADLSLEDAESLACEALGDHATGGRVESLARIGYDCPFLIITGAHLVRSGTLSDADLAAAGVTPTLLRISLGLENTDDIIEDFEQAFSKID